jgi:hypothetical protein
MTRIDGAPCILRVWLLCAAAALGLGSVPASIASASDNDAALRASRDQFVGAWRLVSIDYTGVNGKLADPFYQSDSVGLIVYNASGWMSVQISAPRRPVVPVPASRVTAATGVEAEAKAAAFDSYYAYFGTWDFDPTTSVMTHHVKSSLLPAEVDMSYPQLVTVVGDRMTFIGRDPNHGAPIIRRKVWARITGVGH